LKLKQTALIALTFLTTVTLASFFTAGACAAEPRDVEVESREFKVSVDGKERGKCSMEIHRRDDGSDKLVIDAGMSFNYVVYEYKYHSAGTEIWKDGKLAELENTADFNGTEYVVKAGSASKGLSVSVNGKTTQVEPDVWVTSYWQFPERLEWHDASADKGVVPASGSRPAGKDGGQAVVLLDSDKGKRLRGELRHVGDEMLSIGGKRKTYAHYRISGDVQVDLWYDSARRLVRQESVESGHKTLLELTRVAVGK
jgi:Domain of unknown function (DUF6134)